MTDIFQIKKALKDFHVLFIEDDNEFSHKEIRILFEFLCRNITCIRFDEIERFCLNKNKTIDFVFLNVEFEKMETMIKQIFQINPNQTIVMLVEAKNVIYLEEEFQGNVMSLYYMKKFQCNILLICSIMF